MSVVYLVFGFMLLIKGADLLVEGASSFAKKFNIPDLVIGLTMVSFGTSLAELFVNISASTQHNSDIVIGNIVGSNIFNVSLILGISTMIFPLRVTDNTVWKEIPLSILAAVVFFVLANDQLIDSAQMSVLSRIDGIILLLFFFIFIHYTIALAKEHRQTFEQEVVYKDSLGKALGFIVFGLAALIVGGKWVVSGSVALAVKFNVSNSLIGLTIVAAGTSLPELATSVAAAYKKKPDIAVANIVGSNIFNIFFILGVSSLIHPVQYSTVQNFDAVVCIIFSVLMFLFMFTFKKKSFDRTEGILLVVLYVIYIIFLGMRG